MSRRASMVGKRFGRLVVVLAYPKDRGCVQRWWCRCDCGNNRVVDGSNLRQRRTRSCGCLRVEVSTKGALRHGGAVGRMTPEYRTWQGMLCRCYTKSNSGYYKYGGKGIKVCARWRHTFVNFLKDMGKKPSPQHSIDRIDGARGYAPSNCRWATSSEQARNRVNTHRRS